MAYIFSEVLKKYIDVFSKIEDEYLKERTSDVNDVGKRILRNLLGKKPRSLENLKEKVVVVAQRDKWKVIGQQVKPVQHVWPCVEVMKNIVILRVLWVYLP